ncbi:hypothetical protein [Amycolatopsis palatopharyngis]|uniref:hypothetical protein n=1 Tax=Amycolatopsis palatopharyngis TaxID=187982 RepID=UPI0013BEAABC|nr:hypothetical protein [Amycolatopsis palatopharyngis]
MTRARIAVTCLGVGVCAAPTGAYLQWGLGPALLLVGFLLVLISIVLGWGA